MSTSSSRRDVFARIANGLHGAALTTLLSRDLFAAETARTFDLAPKKPHFEPKAKSVIQFFMNGGPSQVDLFDPSPRFCATPGKRCAT